MKKQIPVISIIISFLFVSIACNYGNSENNKPIATGSATITKGEAIFNKNCSGCHNFKQDGIGPQLGGLTSAVPAAWIEHFIKNPQQIIESGDERAQQLYQKYKVFMPSFNAFSDNELSEIIAFLNVHKTGGRVVKVSAGEIINPLPDTIERSNLIVGLELVTQIPPSGDSGKMPHTRITKLDFQPDTRDLYILDLRGKLYKLQGDKPTVYMDLAKLKPKFINEPGLATGFGSFAFHPQFAKNGLIYTTHTEPAGSAKADFSYDDSIKVTLQWVLTEWKTSRPNEAVFSGTGIELFRANMVAGIHGVQDITFNPLAKPHDEDYGMLYIGVGDGGSVENGYSFIPHSPEKIWGTILRIDPNGRNSANGKYGIPTQNPFVKNGRELGEIYAYGFRNPHRITWSKQRQMLVCNIGQSNIESVNLVSKGGDYGWPVREGRFLLHPDADLNKIYQLPENDSAYHITYPVAQYDHDEGKAISGGFEYCGTAIPQLKGKYLFGDIPSGRLFYINMVDVKQGRQALVKEWKISFKGTMATLAELCKSERVDLHFGRDAKGELYILTKPDGKVYKLTKAL